MTKMPAFRLCDVVLDETIGRATPDVEHERAVAIFDLIEENFFEPAGHSGGPYQLQLSLLDSKLIFAVTTEDGGAVATHILSLTPFRRIVKDYFLICESYYQAIRSATPTANGPVGIGGASASVATALWPGSSSSSTSSRNWLPVVARVTIAA